MILGFACFASVSSVVSSRVRARESIFLEDILSETYRGGN
jgi:hypothetical protein